MESAVQLIIIRRSIPDTNNSPMNIILFDDHSWMNLWPFTMTRPVASIRIGIMTVKEKWEKAFSLAASYQAADYLNSKYRKTVSSDNLFINGSVLPNKDLAEEAGSLRFNEALFRNGLLIAVRLDRENALGFTHENTMGFRKRETSNEFLRINYPWDIFMLNGEALVSDFRIITKGRSSMSHGNISNIKSSENIFIEPGAQVNCTALNASDGPIYIGKNAEIMEGAVIRGPFAIGQDSTVKMGAKIYGPTTIGPHCKVGGEINNTVFFGYSNKAHEGFLGNSVIGEWCNLGADTNNSNLKNNYAEVKVWNYTKERFIGTGLQFCGLFMGDHSKSAINTMFNTGTVVGVFANIFGSGFPRAFIPSFSWGGPQGFTTYNPEKALEVAGRVMERRNIELTGTDRQILQKVFTNTEKYRNY